MEHGETDTADVEEAHALFAGGGEAGALLRAIDWGASPLGPVTQWPVSLKAILKLVLGSESQLCVLWGPDLVQFYNDAFRPILGSLKHPSAMGQRARECWREVWDLISPMYAAVLAGGATSIRAGRLMLDRHGFLEECYFDYTYNPLRDDQSNIAGLLAICTEVTERVLSERRLYALSQLSASGLDVEGPARVCDTAAAVLAQAHADLPFTLIYLLDPDGRKASLAGCSGLPAGHALAPRSITLGEAGSPWELELTARGERTCSLTTLEFSETLKSGLWVEAPKRALVLPLRRGDEAPPVGFLVAGLSPWLALDDAYLNFVRLVANQIASAVQQARVLEQEKQRAEALAQLDRAKTTFFSNVSHEIRTPLTLMLAPIQDMLAAPAGSEVDRDTVSLLERNARRLLKLVNTLLDFSRIEAGRLEARYEPLDLAKLTVELAGAFRSTIEGAGLAFVVDCPQLPEEQYIDRDMWEKIVLNLLSNAFKFTLTGTISVTLRAHQDGVILTVADTGGGIAGHELPQIFERFHRVEGAPSRSHEGTGIGLSLMRELVRLHGGTVEVTSRIGQGSAFSVHLPRGSAHLPSDGIVPRATHSESAVRADAYVEEALGWRRAEAVTSTASALTNPTRNRQRILFADDNADMREYVTRLLGDRWLVEAVADGAEALESARRELPDLVVCDVMMPVLDGLALVRAIRAEEQLRAVPVIVLSARAGEDDIARGLMAGANDYMAKPFSARELLVRVASTLATSRASQEMRGLEQTQRDNLYRHFMQAPFPIAVFKGPQHIIELANPSVLVAWGKSADVIGMPLIEGVPELHGQPFLSWLDQVLSTGVPYEGREQLARVPTGAHGEIEEIYSNFVYAPLRDAGGHVEGVLLSAFIVTEQVRARQALEQALRRAAVLTDKLSATSRAKDEFLATMSHELRTPLNTMLGWATLLREGGHEPARVQHGLAVIERSAKAQERLIGDLLDVSRIVTGKLVLTMRKVVVHELVRAALDAVRQAADAKGIRLLSEVTDDSGTLIADADRLHQVLWNLLTNAIRFTPAGGTVLLGAEHDGSFVHLEVTDSGAGIASEHLPIIFDRFQQIDGSTTRAHGGLGLGLAIVRHLVEAHGGLVSVRSQGLGRGARFEVVLPVRSSQVQTSDHAEPGGAPELTLTAPNPMLQGRRVLLVDDDVDALELLAAIFEQAGARVATASSAKEALERALSMELDLVISDIAMPGLDGYSFIRLLRKQQRKIPAIALSAYARVEDAERAISAGFDKYMVKPVDAGLLLSHVQEILG